MESKRREVSRVLDTQPRIFSVPASIILPVLFMLGTVMLFGVAVNLSVTMVFILGVAVNAVYFFVVGRRWWMFAAKMRTPPLWIRTDVKAIKLTLNLRNEKNSNPRKNRSKRKAKRSY